VKLSFSKTHEAAAAADCAKWEEAKS
jgi:hypothetical protein